MFLGVLGFLVVGCCKVVVFLILFPVLSSLRGSCWLFVGVVLWVLFVGFVLVVVLLIFFLWFLCLWGCW